MFLFLHKFLIFFSILFISGCVSANLGKKSNLNSVSIETSTGKDNILFKENLIRTFKSKLSSNYKFILKASISFSSLNTLSTNGLNALTRTTAIVNFKLYDFQTRKLIKSGSINSFPALGSTSNSLYTNDISLKHIKERLNINIAKKLYMHLNVFLRRLN